MKTLLAKIVLLYPLLFIIIDAGCQKEQDDPLLWEISPNSETAVIQSVVDSIEFKFCLLDEQENPSTVFNENENFYFNFSFKNKMQDTIVVTPEFINSDLFRVYQLNTNIDMGKPWSGIWCEYRLDSQTFSLYPSASIQLNCPWILTEINKPDYPFCMDEDQDYQHLPKGEYFTKIELDFHYVKNEITNIISDKTFIIYFIIQ